MILGYFVLVLAHFVAFSIMKPRVGSSHRGKVKTVYLMVWLVVLCLVLALVVTSSLYSWHAGLFITEWIEAVSELP